MAAPQLTGRKITSGLERAAYTIREFCDDISEFESYHLSHAVRSPPAKCPSENILNPLNRL